MNSDIEQAEQWISVKDRLPDRNMIVKWLCADGVKDIGYFNKKDESFATIDISSQKEITHWQPAVDGQQSQQPESDAVAFADFLNYNYYHPSESTDDKFWYKYLTREPFTTLELYEKFKSASQQPEIP